MSCAGVGWGLGTELIIYTSKWKITDAPMTRNKSKNAETSKDKEKQSWLFMTYIDGYNITT